MAKRKQINGKWHRLRRGKWVEIPTEWVGKTIHPQTIRKRQSKQVRKIRMNPDVFRRKRMRDRRDFHEGLTRKLSHPSNMTPRHRGTKANKIEF